MIRVGAIVSSAALAAVGLTVVGMPAVGATPPAPAPVQGEIVCHFSSGFVKIKPGLLASDSTPGGKVTISGQLAGCNNGEGGAAPGGIIGGKVTGSFDVTETNCNGEVFDDEYPLAYTVKWKLAPGWPKALNSVVVPKSSSFSGKHNSDNFNGFNLSLPGLHGDRGGVVTGSFSHSDLQKLTMQSAADTTIPCTAKTKGLKGSGGLKKVVIETTSTLEIVHE